MLYMVSDEVNSIFITHREKSVKTPFSKFSMMRQNFLFQRKHLGNRV